MTRCKINIEDLIQLIYESHIVEEKSVLEFPRIVDKLPENMEMQDSNIDGIEHEWIYQVKNQWESFHGELAYQLEDCRYLIFGFYSC